jgi:hypothetical protein
MAETVSAHDRIPRPRAHLNAVHPSREPWRPPGCQILAPCVPYKSCLHNPRSHFLCLCLPYHRLLPRAQPLLPPLCSLSTASACLSRSAAAPCQPPRRRAPPPVRCHQEPGQAPAARNTSRSAAARTEAAPTYPVRRAPPRAPPYSRACPLCCPLPLPPSGSAATMNNRPEQKKRPPAPFSPTKFDRHDASPW